MPPYNSYDYYYYFFFCYTFSLGKKKTLYQNTCISVIAIHLRQQRQSCKKDKKRKQ